MKLKPNTTQATQSQLASLLGVSRQLVAAHIKKADAPALDDVAGWTAYLAQVGRIGSAPQELRAEIAGERLALLRASRLKLERENQLASGELISATEAIQQAAQAGSYFMAALERLARTLPQVLSGETSINIAIRLDAEFEKVRKELREKLDAIGNEPNRSAGQKICRTNAAE